MFLQKTAVPVDHFDEKCYDMLRVKMKITGVLQ